VKNWQRYSLVLVAATSISFIAISFLAQEHNPVLAQSPAAGSNTNKLSGTIPKTNSTLSMSSAAGETNSTENPTGIMYIAKFECGSIFAGEGPLRPGHYDTDVSIFNKAGSESTMFWDVVVNNGPSSNAVLVNLGSENATGITCQDVRRVLDDYNDNFLEGFITINVPLDSILQPSKGVIISNANYDTDPLEVQVFYTANALDTLPHEVIVDKIAFYIIQDGTGKIPSNMIRQTLDISIPSALNQLSNTEDRVKEVLANQYNLTSDDLSKVVVRIASVNVGVGVLIDDHAISLSTVRPELAP
jgi:hypothetical protein